MKRLPTLLLVHIVWSTARRRADLPPTLDAPLAELLGAKGAELGCPLLATGAADDHVHAIVRLAPTVCLAALVQRLKGASAPALNERRWVPEGFRWQSGYWAESLSPSALSRLEAYVRGQRRHHDDAHPAEDWLRRLA
ncbi:MAG TPA: IS200/IS605 family transposase [Polyangiaceae bacterium]|nr:IS200/IS605 family transposase [Polyangiaceae bacterium]